MADDALRVISVALIQAHILYDLPRALTSYERQHDTVSKHTQCWRLIASIMAAAHKKASGHKVHALLAAIPRMKMLENMYALGIALAEGSWSFA